MSASKAPVRADAADTPSESTPLLSSSSSTSDAGARGRASRRSSSIYSHDAPRPLSSAKSRHASFIALGLLSLLALLIMLVGFFVPDTMRRYATDAAVIDIKSIVPEFTDIGARARIQVSFSLQSSRVDNAFVRVFGRFGTWIARKAETGEAHVDVTLPEYKNVLLGSAVVPPIVVSIVDGKSTDLDVSADLIPPTSIDGVKDVIDQWFNKSLDHLVVLGTATMKLKSGLIRLPAMDINHGLTINGNDIPAMPKFNITKLLVREGELPDQSTGMVADATVVVENDFPVDFFVPPLNFDLLVSNCFMNQPKIDVATATVHGFHVQPRTQVAVNATGFIQKLPGDLTDACPSNGRSPLDTLLGGYIAGREITVYIKGSDQQAPETPNWMSEIVSQVTVPVPVPGHTFGEVIRNFTLADIDFTLPDPYADPDSPESNPLISAMIEAFITLPQEVNFVVDVQRVRADADVYYKGKKLGELDLHKWRPATSKPAGVDEANRPLLQVDSAMKNVPLHITNQDLFTDVIQALLFGGKNVLLQIRAKVDVEVNTMLGVLTIRDIPANGTVPVKPLSGALSSFAPKIGGLKVLKTSSKDLLLAADVSFNNPTVYSATVPYADVHLYVNDTMIGNATVRDIRVIKGLNEQLSAQALWNPFANGEKGRLVARDVLSQYISGQNLTLTVRVHENSIPSLPILGRALQKIKITIPAPHLDMSDPDDDDDDPDDGSPKHTGFIKGAMMHLVSSTATFTLHSPLLNTDIFVTHINATAFYKDDQVGTILQDAPIAVPPGTSTTPRLPVSWSLGSVGYDAVRKALGGNLRLKAKAVVGVEIGEYTETIWYEGKGIGAKIRL